MVWTLAQPSHQVQFPIGHMKREGWGSGLRLLQAGKDLGCCSPVAHHWVAQNLWSVFKGRIPW